MPKMPVYLISWAYQMWPYILYMWCWLDGSITVSYGNLNDVLKWTFTSKNVEVSLIIIEFEKKKVLNSLGAVIIYGGGEGGVDLGKIFGYEFTTLPIKVAHDFATLSLSMRYDFVTLPLQFLKIYIITVRGPSTINILKNNPPTQNDFIPLP